MDNVKLAAESQRRREDAEALKEFKASQDKFLEEEEKRRKAEALGSVGGSGTALGSAGGSGTTLGSAGGSGTASVSAGGSGLVVGSVGGSGTALGRVGGSGASRSTRVASIVNPTECR